MNFIQAFNNIKELFDGVDTSVLEKDFAIQVNLVNKDCGGAFYIAYKDGVFAVEPYDYHDRDALVTAMYGDFTRLMTGKLNPEKVLESGKIALEGDRGIAAELIKLIQKPAPAKKAAPVKKATKKPAAKKPAAKK